MWNKVYVPVILRSLLREVPPCGKRGLATEAAPEIFDRKSKRMQRDRAASKEGFHKCDRIRHEVAYLLSDRILDVTRSFDHGLDLGCAAGSLGSHIDPDTIRVLEQADLSSGMLQNFRDDARDQGYVVQADEEALPWRENTFDIVASNLALHWVNDLPGTLRQIKNILVPDGLFIATMFGGDTLFELRGALQTAEMEVKGGFSPRISPFVDVRDCGSLLQRAGFTLLTVDIDELTVNYPSPMHVISDVRNTGESNAATKRQSYLDRATLQETKERYISMYGNSDGTVPATYQVINLLGWKPSPTQASPARRGSATASLKELGVSVDKLVADMDKQKT